MKKIFEYFGLFCLICFSFIITEKTTTVVQEVDDIMIQIKQEMDLYKVDGMNALIDGDTIIPGLVSKSVNIDKSYKNMKEKGVYNSSFYIYDLNKPDISVEDNLSKYITNGNKKKNMISLVFIVDNKNIMDIQSVVGDTPVSFVFEDYNIDSQIDNIINITKLNNEILIQNISNDNYKLVSNKLKSIGVSNKFCFNPEKNKSFLDLCSKDNLYSITSNNIIETSPLKSVKKDLTSGYIFIFKINDEVLKELPNVISYIKSRGYSIETLSNHLSENW